MLKGNNRNIRNRFETFQVNSKDTKTTSSPNFRVSFVNFEHNYNCVPFHEFEQVNIFWDILFLHRSGDGS